MAKNVYPTADTDGFLTDDLEIAARILNDYNGTQYSQSVLWYGHLKSLDYSIKSYGHSEDELRYAIASDLATSYDPYLENVTIDVAVGTYICPNTGEETGKTEIKMGVWFDYKGEQVSLTQAVLTNRDVIERIWEIVRR